MFTLLFTYVFGGAITVPGHASHPQYLLPGIMVQVMAFASIGTATGIAEDMGPGLVDRFRSLPISRAAVLAGRSLSDLAQRCFQLSVLVAVGLAVGWRTHTGPVDIIAGLALLMAFGTAFGWVGAWVGMVSRNVEAASNLGLLWRFPLTFIANTFVPLAGMPTWLLPVAEWNPISSMVAATRVLFGDPVSTGQVWPLAHPVIASLA